MSALSVLGCRVSPAYPCEMMLLDVVWGPLLKAKHVLEEPGREGGRGKCPGEDPACAPPPGTCGGVIAAVQ